MRNAPLRRLLRLFGLLLSALVLGSASAQDPDAVWILPIDTEITPATAQFVASRVERANDAQPLALLLRIDTPGGRVDSMQRIVDTLMNDARVPVLAVVENAFSAGALIAMSAEQLAMLPGASIGAALPIAVGVGGASPVDEKFTSAVRGQFRSVAQARGRNARVAEAMVDPSIEIPGLSASGELVTLSAEEAVAQNIADVVARDVPDALTQFGYGGVATATLERNLTERIGTWLAGPIIAGILLVLGIGGLVLEFFTPGFGIPGAIGVIALALFATTAFVATPAGTADVLLILAGLLLLALEAFVVPGFGVAGVLGAAAITAAVIRIFQNQAVTVLATAAIGGGVVVALLLWLLPSSRFGKIFTLSERIGSGSGADARNGGPSVDPDLAKFVGDRSHLVGTMGTAASDLRPAGVARFGDERVHVVTEGDYISTGTRIRVLRIEGTSAVVRGLDDEDATRD